MSELRYPRLGYYGAMRGDGRPLLNPDASLTRKEKMRVYSRTYEAKQRTFCAECVTPINRHHKLCRSCASRRQWDKRRAGRV